MSDEVTIRDDSYTPPISDSPVETIVESLAIAEPVAVETKESLHAKIEACLKEHNGLEGNIGISHAYWGWLNDYRGMLRSGS